MNFVYDGKMNYERAKKELELGDSFTDVELTQAYHRLVNKCHPDINGNTDEEKRSFSEHMKAINAAYDFLKGKTANFSKTNDYDFSFEEYKKEKMIQFLTAIHFTGHFIENYGLEFKYLEEEILSFGLCIGPLVEKAKNKEQVDSIINAAYKGFDDLLSRQVDYFCTQHGITKQEINKAFNLELELKKRNPNELCIKLKNVLEKIKKVKIEEIIQKYVGYTGYIDIKDKIDLFKQQAMNSNDNINEIVKKLQQNIDKTFENYFDNMKLIDELYELTKSVDDEEILEELKESMKQINHYDFKKRYDDLKRKIYNYNMSKELDLIFRSINQKGAEALKNCKSMFDSSKIYTIFSKIFELINRINANQLPVTEELKDMLNLVTFKDFKSDIDILDSLISIKKQIHDISNIYVKKDFYDKFDAVAFFIERDGRLYRICDGFYDGIVFKDENLIPLSKFLSEARIETQFCEENSFLYDNKIIYQICTYKDGRSICLVINKALGSTISEIKIYDSKNLISISKSGIQEEQYLKYTNPKYLTKVISEQLNKILDKNLVQNSEKQSLEKK